MTFEIGLHVGGGRKYGRTEGHVITKISCAHRDSWCSAARASRVQELPIKYVIQEIAAAFVYSGQQKMKKFLS